MILQISTEELLRQAERTIEMQTKMLSGFGLIYTIITIIIALVAIALPILTYQFGIKPSRNAIREFEDRMDSKLKEFLNSSKSNLINKAIENISNESESERKRAILYLELNKYEHFEDIQLFRIYESVAKLSFSDSDLSILFSVLVTRNNQFVEDLFSRLTFLRKSVVLYHSIYYSAANGLSVLEECYCQLMKDTGGTGQFSTYDSLLVQSSHINRDLFFDFLNSKNIIDSIDDDNRRIIKANSHVFYHRFNITPDELSETLLGQEVLK